MKNLFLSLCMAVAIVTPASAKEKLGKAEKAAIAASPQQVADTIEVKSDPLDTVVRLSSEPFYKQKGVFGITSGDKFLRAMIDKKTGATLVQVYLWFTYSGEWLFIDRMNYLGPDGLKSIEGKRIDSDVGSCSAYGCTKTEHVAFSIPLADLEFASKDAQAGDDGQWQFKLFGRYETGQTTGLLKTEVAGMLLAVAREQEKLKPAKEAPAPQGERE
jgi:hypothetical protein